VSNPGVPFVDLSRALASERAELLAAADRVIRSGWLIHGTEHRSFETELARYLGVGHVIGVGNGTDALELALRAVNRDERRTVLTVANAGGYTTTAARAAGFRVGYVDVDPQTHLMDVSAAATAIDDDTFAVVITHLYGRAADVAGLRAICEPRGISVIEDCAQAIGCAHRGRPGGVNGRPRDLQLLPDEEPWRAGGRRSRRDPPRRARRAGAPT
jgi:Predicted pyridoxal phosphate-dependent enzyme apparently involved in regulation of cell wall biogenesis